MGELSVPYLWEVPFLNHNLIRLDSTNDLIDFNY